MSEVYNLIDTTKPVCEVEILPRVTLQLNQYPSLWKRFGMFIWFGLKVKPIEEQE